MPQTHNTEYNEQLECGESSASKALEINEIYNVQTKTDIRKSLLYLYSRKDSIDNQRGGG